VLVVGTSAQAPLAVPEPMAGDPRVTCLVADGAGTRGAARNHGIEAAHGEWLAFCDDGALWAPSKLMRQLAAVRTEGLWSGTSAVTVDRHLRITGGHRLASRPSVRQRLLSQNVIPGGASSVLVHRSAMERIGGFAPTLTAGEDWDCWVRLSRLGEPAIVDRPLVACPEPTGAMGDYVAETLASRGELRRRLAEEAGQREIDALEIEDLRVLADQCLRAGDARQAALLHVSLAGRGAPGRHLPTAALALLTPRLLARARRRRSLKALPPGWLVEAQDWLAGIRSRCPPPP
jgi:hypothetical protein